MDRDDRATAPSHATGAVEFVSLDDIADDLTFRLREPGDVSDLAASMGRLGQLVPVEVRPLPGTRPDPSAGRPTIEDVVLADLPGPRWQVVAGFRRLEALKLLHRDRVLARIHRELTDEDAWALALSKPLLAEPLLASDLEALRERLPAAGAEGWGADLLEDALARTPVSPEHRERFLAFLAQGPATVPGAIGPAPVLAAPAAAPPLAEPGPSSADEGETLEVTPDELALHVAVRLFELNQELAVAWEVWRELPVEGRRHIIAQARYLAELFPLMDRETE